MPPGTIDPPNGTPEQILCDLPSGLRLHGTFPLILRHCQVIPRCAQCPSLPPQRTGLDPAPKDHSGHTPPFGQRSVTETMGCRKHPYEILGQSLTKEFPKWRCCFQISGIKPKRKRSMVITHSNPFHFFSNMFHCVSVILTNNGFHNIISLWGI